MVETLKFSYPCKIDFNAFPLLLMISWESIFNSFSNSSMISAVFRSPSPLLNLAILNKASIILVFISSEALFVKVMATIDLNLFGDLVFSKIDKYCNTN